MKTSFKSILALAVFGASTLVSQAQTAPKILIIDLGKVFQGHYKTAQQQDALQVVQQKVEAELGNMNKALNALIEEYKGFEEQAKNPAITAEARAKVIADAEKKGAEIQTKQNDAQNYLNNARRQLAEQSQAAQNVLVEEISKVATEIAKQKGATILLNKPAAVYADASYDISDEVLAAVNKGKPATAAATPAAKPAAAPAAPASNDAAPTVSFPGAKK
ncbi:MAG: OmpH family outer membrane protein [Verrucomicrobia bacterium]|nr:OmpH family outer membrane protein [Verrucomicrobiota bacterium]